MEWLFLQHSNHKFWSNSFIRSSELSSYDELLMEMLRMENKDQPLDSIAIKEKELNPNWSPAA